jgi:hypothetical protein
MAISGDLGAGTFHELRRAHCVNIPRRQAQVLVQECLGNHHAEIASKFGISLSTVQKEAAQAHARVVPAYFDPTHARAVAWGWLHNSCCLATQWAQAGLPFVA